MHSQINFGYPWAINYGHLVLGLALLALFAFGFWRKWNKVLLGVLGLITLWAITAGIFVRFGFDMNGRGTLPTQAFMRQDTGRVLDMGAGTGRSTLMVLEARPHVNVVALDLFGDSYTEHFGAAKEGGAVDEGQARLMSNLKAAGVADRAAIQPGDMTHMPLEANSFDGIVSAYAIDHLGHQGAVAAVGEAHRVLKPGGEFLLMVIGKDFWLSYTFGPMLMHSKMVPADYWSKILRDGGFTIEEEGLKPATKYILARKL